MLNLKSVKQFCRLTGIYNPTTKILYRRLHSGWSAQFRQEVAFFSNLLEPNSLCFDVGANVGDKTEAFLQAGAKVVAFEPQPDCEKILETRCKRYQKKLQTCQSALGTEPGEVTLYVRESSSQSSLREKWEGKVKNCFQVPVTTLDRAIAKYGKPSYCKIDVEGWELEVLKGLSQPIPLLSFEYHLHHCEIGNVYTCLNYLSNFGEIRINITPSSKMRSFAFPKWLSLKEFFRVFPKDFQKRKEYSYGDIFVQTY
jgi:FkbM family methyltransferase